MTTNTNELNNEPTFLQSIDAKLNEANSIKDMKVIIQEMCLKIAELEQQPKRGRKGERDYGPKSENAMTELMAWRIMFGDLSDRSNWTVRKIADEFGLSRGQVYSVTGCYTFTKVKEDSFTMDDVTTNEE